MTSISACLNRISSFAIEKHETDLQFLCFPILAR